jgi:hypothetical protein
MISPLAKAKETLSITEAWSRCGLLGQPKNGMNKSPFRQDSSPSFSIYANGTRWKDFGTDEGGSVVDFVAKAKGLAVPDACKAVIQMAGLPASGNEGSSHQLAPKLPSDNPKPITITWDYVEKIWDEGQEWLVNNPKTQEAIAKWRGWPIHWIETLVESGSIGCPIHKRLRCVAFLVLKPTQDGAVRIGYHLREKKSGGWKFMPNGGTKPYPFFMGCPLSSRLIILEGQWDAVTLAGTAGWLDRHEAWPSDVAVIGMRGANSTGVFMKDWGNMMEKTKPDVLIIRDADTAGETWKTSFAPKLARLAKSVRLFRMAEAKDLNDAYKLNPLTPQDVWEILGANK